MPNGDDEAPIIIGPQVSLLPPDRVVAMLDALLMRGEQYSASQVGELWQITYHGKAWIQ